MEMNTQDHLKKALVDTQERVRDYMLYAEKAEDKKLKNFFQDCAKTEGLQAQELQALIHEMCD